MGLNKDSLYVDGDKWVWVFYGGQWVGMDPSGDTDMEHYEDEASAIGVMGSFREKYVPEPSEVERSSLRLSVKALEERVARDDLEVNRLQACISASDNALEGLRKQLQTEKQKDSDVVATGCETVEKLLADLAAEQFLTAHLEDTLRIYMERSSR